jgi:Amt family ammonium transporter
VAPVAALAFWVIGKVAGNRVSVEDEIAGLDVPEMGVPGYSSDPGPIPGVPRADPAPAALPVGKPVPSF